MFDMADWDNDRTGEGGELPLSPVFVSEPLRPEREFSVVTLVRDEASYRRLLQSFADKGFTEDNSEFIAIDNRDENRFDGYRALRAVAPRLRGRHVLFTHDDIELIGDDFDRLLIILEKLEAADPYWMIAGNSGLFADEFLAHLDDPHGKFRLKGDSPAEVRALDENFLVMPRARMPMPSLDLDGFHLYATDMCLQARMAGGRAYVLPFLVRHHSGGTETVNYRETQKRLQKKYSGFGISGRLRAPASDLFFGWRGHVIQRTDRPAKWLKRKIERSARLFARSARDNTESK